MPQTNRTASTRWKRVRARRKRAAIRDGTFICVECREPLDPKAPPNTRHAAELDHIIPVAVRPDLEYDPANHVWRCHPCNRRKGKGADPLVRMPTTRTW